MKKPTIKFALLIVFMLWAVGAQAINSLQLGAGSDAANWGYDNTSQTWLYSGADNPFDILATANATKAAGGNGDYAWDAAGAANQYAYLVISAVPHLSSGTDYFDISVSDGSGVLSLVDSGYGNPPLNDPNSMAPHGIFDAYFEIFEFQFDGAVTDIVDTQPGTSGMGKGFKEYLDITVNSLMAGVEGVHFDLFSAVGDRWDPSDPENRKMVLSVAPFSHDGGTGKCCDRQLAEPGTLGLMLIGMVGVGASRIRRRRSRK